MTDEHHYGYDERGHTPRWMIFLLDLVISISSMVLAYQLRFNFSIPAEWSSRFSLVFPLVIIVRGGSFLVFRTFAGLIRYTGTGESGRLLYVASTGTGILTGINLLAYVVTGGILLFPMSVLLIDLVVLLFLLTTTRMFMRNTYYELFNKRDDRKGVIIYGTGQGGLVLKHTLEREMGRNFRVVGFMDETERIAGKKIEGVMVHDVGDLRAFLERTKIHSFIFSKDPPSPEKKVDIVDVCLDFDMKVLSVPHISSWISSRLAFNQIKSVHIDDLLERTPVPVNDSRISSLISGKVIMITGAAGSIGSEIVRQVKDYDPGKLILVDQAESALYDLELKIREEFNQEKCMIVAANIADETRMASIFAALRPQIIFHAAAYKHIPMMENNPAEALRTNICATKLLAELASDHGCDKFVFISTDKAVHPANVAGASKRIAELCLLDIQKRSGTRFSIVRFGNVLGSNGSVIPRFRKQIETGGPVTITHPEVTRYFMTSTIAAQLILEAGAMSEGGEIFVFEMGHSIRIYDLARKMIKLTGLVPGQDIEIKFTGLRAGEKINEEIMYTHEYTTPTDNPKISLVLDRNRSCDGISGKIEALTQLLPGNDNDKILAAFSDILPGFQHAAAVKSKD
ncbi:MAG: polysaccharide biosynthesis protein [Marinilabiliales bacterium]|nr:MAG: polysaccharide biosynthesis protein [Marinilabiliales bacterium]